VILIDGYVWLESDKSPGLGAALYAELNRSTPVIGVAKSRYKNSDVAYEVMRGSSARPLYITAVGIDQRVAAAKIVKMHGKHRLPTLLKKVDQLSKISKYRR
jgi:deoxyribonuclease V